MEMQSLNENLIQAIKKSILPKEKIANVLMNTLSMGKEAVYRRLRGEVAFTFEEITKLALKYNISVDKIMGIDNAGRAVFDVNLFEPENLLEHHVTRLEYYIKNLQKIRRSGKPSYTRLVSNTVPSLCYFAYTHLSKFFLYKWLSLRQGFRRDFPYCKMLMPQKVIDTQNLLVTEAQLVTNTVIILDNSMFGAIVADIQYFYMQQLLTAKDVDLLKLDLLNLLSEMEVQASCGYYSSGKEIQFYISNLNFDTSYLHFECDDFEHCYLRIYGIDGLDSRNSYICKVQKKWIDDLKRHSTLISQSGELHRLQFFNTQREIIMKLDAIIL